MRLGNLPGHVPLYLPLERELRLEALEIEVEAVTQGGLMRYASENPFVRKRFAELLTKWRQRMSQRGRDFYGGLTYAQLFGKRSSEEFEVGLRDGFRELASHSLADSLYSNAQPPDTDSPDRGNEARLVTTAFIDDQLRIIQRLEECPERLGENRSGFASFEETLPPVGASYRLIRYEVHLNRELDRTLTQLERLQRMRLGYAVPSPTKIDVSS